MLMYLGAKTAAIYARISLRPRRRPARRDPPDRGLPRRSPSGAAGRSPTCTSTTTAAPTPASPARSTGGCSTTSRRCRVDAVVVWHLDRLHRQPQRAGGVLRGLRRGGLRSMASVTGDIDLSSHDGRSSRVSSEPWPARRATTRAGGSPRKHLELAQAGKPTGGGTRRSGTAPDRVTVEPPRRPRSARLSPAFSPATASADRDRLERPRPATASAAVPGRCTSSGGCSCAPASRASASTRARSSPTGDWEPILTPDDTARLRVVLNDPARPHRRTVRRYLLSGGLLRCSLCGAALLARPRADGTRRYVCAKGPGLCPAAARSRSWPSPRTAVAEAVLYRLDTPELAAASRSRRGRRGGRGPARRPWARSEPSSRSSPGRTASA